MSRGLLLAVVALLATPAGAAAAPSLQPVGTFADPVHIAGPPGDPARLFVVEKAGRVQLVVDGQRRPVPFLDVAATVDDTGERGLLSIAFPHDYATSGLFHVFRTVADGTLVIAEGRRSAANPEAADPGLRPLFSVPHPGASNHNGASPRSATTGCCT